jgi:site-specific DNA recombinase
MYLKLGSLLPVVEELAKQAWRNKSWVTKKGDQRGGREFDKSSLYDLLRNPLYVGKLKHKTERFDGEHEAIIDPETFRKVQSLLQEHARGKGNFLRNQGGALLKGLIHCQACGHAMVHTFTGRGSKRYRYYTCTKAMKKGYKSCPAKSLPAAEIERVVIQQLQALGHDETLRAEILQQAQRQLDHELQDMETEQRQLDRQLARHQAEAHQLISTPGSSQANSSRIVELHVQIARVQHRLVEIKQRTEQIENRRLSDPDIDAAFDNFDELWRSLSTRE